MEEESSDMPERVTVFHVFGSFMGMGAEWEVWSNCNGIGQ